MAFDLSETLVVGISATALFDLSAEDALYQQQFAEDPDNAIEVYRRTMEEKENEDLNPGAGYSLVQALLKLNKFQQPGASPLVEVVVMSRNSPETGLRVLTNIRRQQLSITRSAFTAGESVTDYLDAFDVDLFLTTNVADAQRVIDSRTCAAAVLKMPPVDMDDITTDQVRIAFDGDAVLFSDESELVYKTKGLNEFLRVEDAQQDTPLEEGPYAALLKKLSTLQDRLPVRVEFSPVRIALVTARSSPAEMRVIKTLRKWGVYVDEAFFLGGVEKTKVLKAFKPHIFFDDQDIHLERASKVVPSGKVPYHSTSPLHLSRLQKQQAPAGHGIPLSCGGAAALAHIIIPHTGTGIMDIGAKEFIESAMEGLRQQTAAHDEAWGISRAHSWNADLDKAELAFTFEDGTIATAPIQIVGTYDAESGTFLWGWEHPSVPEPLRNAAAKARAWGEANDLEIYTSPNIKCPQNVVWEFTAVTARLAEANGAYRGEVGPTQIFMTFGPITLSKPAAEEDV